MGTDVLALPFTLQLSLGSGYLAYLIAYSGIRQHHSTADTLFLTLAFGLLASCVMYFAPFNWLTVAAAILAPLAAGSFWRWRGMAWSASLLRQSDISWVDDIPTAWLSIVAGGTQVRPSQIAVDLDNGRTLFCSDTRDFTDAPHGPCVFGLDGSVAFYVTDERTSDGEWLDKPEVKDSAHGPMLTYVPASSIKRVEIRCWTKANGEESPNSKEDKEDDASPPSEKV